MAYNNRMPVLSRIDKGVRDNDFIPISELKEFDKKLNKISKDLIKTLLSRYDEVNKDLNKTYLK